MYPLENSHASHIKCYSFERHIIIEKCYFYTTYTEI
jgi:hypothetical protein